MYVCRDEGPTNNCITAHHISEIQSQMLKPIIFDIRSLRMNAKTFEIQSQMLKPWIFEVRSQMLKP